MEQATISQLKNRLSAYLKKVKAGETVLILDRNRPVARLEGIAAGEHGGHHLADLERRGLVYRSSRLLPLDELKIPPVVPSESVLDALLQERRENR